MRLPTAASLDGAATIKFGILVGFCAILIDASIAHGLFWENDPYWTYWITKTFLITTIFTLGTAFFGIGIVQGLVITAVHTLVLEVYYQFFAPVGLPQEPMWLPEEDLWFPWGVPPHYLAIGAGYFLAMWVWRRRERLAEVDAVACAVVSILGAVVVIVLDALLSQLLLLGHFSGLTFYVQHLLIGVVFLFVWTSLAGWDTRGWIVGSVLLALIWTTYSMYLGPVDLPFTARPTYLGYEDLWLRSFPGATVAALAGLFVTRAIGRRLSSASVAVAPP